MLYAMHEAAFVSATPLRLAAEAARTFWGSGLNPAAESGLVRRLFASADAIAQMTRRFGKPAWRIETVEIGGEAVAVTQETVWSSPWCNLVRFSVQRPDSTADAPAVLLVAPLSGHYATLLRGTVQGFLQDHDVYVTDWANARDVQIIEGRFGFHDFADHVADMIRAIGRRAHVVAVCQPGPPVLVAATLMAEDNDPLRPLSMTFMGSPIDARLSPTKPNLLAEQRPFAWFQSNMIHTVPPPYLGTLRRVYPGFVQLYSFLSMNEKQHVDAHYRHFENLVAGDDDSTDRHRLFYDEYLSVLDLTEEFYLETIDIVFQRYLLPKGELTHRGRRVDPGVIRDIAIMTVEGANDDISGVGQTQAAHTLCSNVPEDDRVLYVHPTVGHYGVFNGRRFRDDIYPRVRDFIAARQL